MSEYYNLNGKSIFSIVAVGEFPQREDELTSATSDATLMRAALRHLGMTEYGRVIGSMRSITKTQVTGHMARMSCSSELAQCDMVVLVISSHGNFDNGQYVSFSDGSLILKELIKPVKMKMNGKPLIVFVSACRSTEHNLHTRIMRKSCIYTRVIIMF